MRRVAIGVVLSTTIFNRCTLILTEGDSAKTLAVAGLGVVGRDYYGVFPLRGKLLNVREASHKQVTPPRELIGQFQRDLQASMFGR